MRLAPALVALAVLLAGCVGAEETPVEDAAADAPRAGAATTAGAPPQALGVDARPHLHDYWSGRERVRLFEGDVTPGAADDAFFATTFSALFSREARVGGVAFLLPEGSIVFEGTGAMELTATPVDPTTTSVAVSLKPANTPEYGAPVALPAGKSVSVPVTPEMTDMPHSSTSRWAFFFQAEAPGAMLGAFHLTVDVVKMRDVALFPGHPDLFAGQPSKVLFEGHHRTEKAAYATRVAYLAQNGDFGEPEFAPTEVVPMETVLVRVEVTVTKTEAMAGEVEEVRFFFRGADSNQLQAAGRAPLSEGPTFVWDVPVEMVMTDSPYASQSQWRFMVEPATSFSDADPTCGGCVDSALEFDARITAFAVLPEDARVDEGADPR